MFSFVAFLLLAAIVANGQKMYGGKPTDRSLLKSAIPSFTMPGFDLKAFHERQRSEPKHQQGGYLIAEQFDVSISPLNSGVWETLADGTQVWRVEIISTGAVTINLWLSAYQFNEGNALYVYNKDMTYIRGQFNEKNNKRNGLMAIAPIPGDHVVVEIVVQPNAQMPIFEIGKVNHEAEKAFGDSDPCNINVVCPYTADFDMVDEVDSVAMILTAAGSRRCTGALINNAANDPNLYYFLTANHCAGGEATWIFMFNYQSSQCNLNQQTDGPTQFTVQGSSTIDQQSASDVLLLQLDEDPSDYDVYYAGFNAVDNATIPFAIHHPSGDIKKIAWSEQNTVSDSWSGIANTHWQVVEWNGPGTGAGNQGDRTTTEPGSSGSPLFDLQGRIIGQLHGGAATCAYPYDDLYGKLARSWDDLPAIARALDNQNNGQNRVANGRRASKKQN